MQQLLGCLRFVLRFESKARKAVLELARMSKSPKVQPLVDVAASFKHEKSFRGLLERGMC